MFMLGIQREVTFSSSALVLCSLFVPGLNSCRLVLFLLVLKSLYSSTWKASASDLKAEESQRSIT